MTLYPRPNPWSITDVHIAALTTQLTRYVVDEKLRVLLRFAPEMNGNWKCVSSFSSTLKLTFLAITANNLRCIALFGSELPMQLETQISRVWD